jgi:hypothetical protein
MGYTIGVSSGMHKLAQPNEKEMYLTMLRKAFWGAMKGVTFTQIDLESITEFNEPFLKESVQKIKELGLKFGIHGETAATGIHTMVLESALQDEYDRSHERLLKHIEGSGKMGAVYCLTHASEAMPIKLIGTMALQSTRIVDFYGRDMRDFFEENPDILEWAQDKQFLQDMAFGSPYVIQTEEDYLKSELYGFKRMYPNREPTEEELKKLKENATIELIRNRKINIRDCSKRQGVHYGTERIAYAIIAKYLELRQDPIWERVVGKGAVFDEKMFHDYRKWVPAVTAKYIWGHFYPLKKLTGKFSSTRPSYPDPIRLLEKYDLMWTFEPEMAQGGWESYMRLVSIQHIYELVNAINHRLVKVAIDSEHLLSAGEDPMKNVDKLPFRGGKEVTVVHLGWPTPHIPAHVPIYLGSEAQHWNYELLYKLRQKGMKDAIFIFERGGGEDPVKTSVISIRKIVKYLLKDVNPKDLPPDFFGLDPNGPEFARQQVNLHMHAYDPLAGLLTQPEEEHGLLGKTALEKGKGEQWKKGKYR